MQPLLSLLFTRLSHSGLTQMSGREQPIRYCYRTLSGCKLLDVAYLFLKGPMDADQHILRSIGLRLGCWKQAASKVPQSSETTGYLDSSLRYEGTLSGKLVNLLKFSN